MNGNYFYMNPAPAVVYAVVGVPIAILYRCAATHCRCCVFVRIVLQFSNHQQPLGSYELNEANFHYFEYLTNNKISILLLTTIPR